MKKNQMVAIILTLSMLFCFSGVVLGGGIEPPGGGLPPQGSTADCYCIVNAIYTGQPVEIPELKGPYLKGTFTISYYMGTEIEPSWVSHIFLRWGNRIFVQPFYTLTGGADLVNVTDEQLKDLLLASQILCYSQVEEYFGLEGTPFIKELLITDRGGLDTSAIGDDIIRGEITVSVAPAVTCPE